MVKFELKSKETGTKTIAMATLNYAPCHVLYRVMPMQSFHCIASFFPEICLVLCFDLRKHNL